MTPAKKFSILLVDDEPEILFSLQMLLRREFEVYTAPGGAAALEILRQHPVQVIMTDQRMPEMTGTELLRKARGERPEALRILFTGYADVKAVIDAINHAQVYRYLTKPWDPDELRELLHEACEQHERHAERRRLLTEMRDHAGHCPELAQRADAAELRARLDRALA
jgi:DNA-binding NtrC family response regulator